MALIGAGWIAPAHLRALDRLGRTTLVGVASAGRESAAAIAMPRGVPDDDNVARLLDEQRPDVAFVCVPPAAAVGIGLALVERGIPFLIEKPLAAADAEGPVRLAAAIADRELVVAVGYHLRGLDFLPEVRAELASAPPRTVVGRWLDGTPGPTWWRHAATGGGQVIEQATHLYDLARVLVGEATVIDAVDVPAAPPDATSLADHRAGDDGDVADGTAALLRFETGAIGAFVNTRRAPSGIVDLDLSGGGRRLTIRHASDDGERPATWELVVDDGSALRVRPATRDPYEVQAEAFLDAVEAGDPGRVLASYAEALRTDRLTRAVVAATGNRG